MAVETDWRPALTEATLVLVAVPDDAIAEVAAALAETGAIGAGHVVLHTSGLHDRSALAALSGSGAALGSLHPLQTFATAFGDTDLLKGIPAVLEGDPRAVAASRSLAVALEMGTILELPASGKTTYHAAAVVASNYLVVLADLAERLASAAGAGEAAATLFLPIMRQTLENTAALGAAKALTGPVRRGDIGTVAAHLAVLEGDSRTSYLALAHEALRLARRAGLAAEAAADMESLLRRSARD
jgi:predicted short-subunit dehydrogenase-like oxidoreductase (DUF2520 family)